MTVLVGGTPVQLDAADAWVMGVHPWRISVKRQRNGRIYRYVVFSPTRRTTVLLHRLLTGCPDAMKVDHRDGDGLNNCRKNLRVCTHTQNMHNRRPTAGRDLPKGVQKHDGRYRAEIQAHGIRRRKRFATVEAAHACYLAWAAELHGDFAFEASTAVTATRALRARRPRTTASPPSRTA